MGRDKRDSDIVGKLVWLALAIVASGLVSYMTVKKVERSQLQTSSASAVFGDKQPKFVHEHPIALDALYRQATPAIVTVDASAHQAGKALPSQELLGSGFLVDSDGHIVTNYHVVRGSSVVDVTLSDGERLQASVLGSDPSNDIALLKVAWPDPNVRPLTLGDSARLVVGEDVAAIGNPLGLDGTLTTGVVSALDRTIQAPNGFPIPGVIQTDASLNRGSSGGPLFDAGGQVVGVTSAIEAVNSGIGYAVPINTVRRVVADILAGRQVKHAFLGVRTLSVTPELARVFKMHSNRGALVMSTDKGGPSAGKLRASTKLREIGKKYYKVGGDIILRFGPYRIDSTQDIALAISHYQPGQTVKIEVRRGRRLLWIPVRLAVRPANATP